MNSLKIGAALAVLVGANVAAATADAADWYGAVHVGQSEITGSAYGSSVELNEGTSYGAAIGTSVGPFRVEAGADQLSGDLAGFADVDLTAYSATAYLDLSVGDNASVFVGAGADYLQGELNVPGYSMSESGDGYHWAVGGAYRLSEKIVGEVQFRQITGDIAGIDVDANQFSVGARFRL